MTELVPFWAAVVARAAPPCVEAGLKAAGTFVLNPGAAACAMVNKFERQQAPPLLRVGWPGISAELTGAWEERCQKENWRRIKPAVGPA